jgi:hypothetical protein
MLPASRVGRKAEPVIHTAVISSQLELHGIYVDPDQQQRGVVRIPAKVTGVSG